MSMNQGYPSTADILSFMTANGFEEITEDNTDFRAEFLQHLWNIIHATAWAMALRVYANTATTFKIVGGRYYYQAQENTYTSEAAIDPTDNDTTYVWMNTDNTIGHDIDGNGWPVGDHIKLAEVTVDADGVITNITDLRGTSFMRAE